MGRPALFWGWKVKPQRLSRPNMQSPIVWRRTRDQMLQKLCSNSSIAEKFLSDVRAMINGIRASGKYTAAFSANAVILAYIENENNAQLIKSNCSGYFDGLKNLFSQRRQPGRIVGRRFRRLIRRRIFRIVRSLLATEML